MSIVDRLNLIENRTNENESKTKYTFKRKFYYKCLWNLITLFLE